MRDGSDLVGWGMASGVWEALQMESAARIVLTANGHAEIACAFSDIGTGTYTIVPKMAADLLGLPLDNITVKLGDLTLPQAPVEGGSWTAASVSHAVAKTAAEVRKALLGVAKTMAHSPLANTKPDDAALADGKIVDQKDKGLVGVNRRRHASWPHGSHRAGEHQHVRRRAPRRPATRIRRSSPR